jgi:hypothetical protein
MPKLALDMKESTIITNIKLLINQLRAEKISQILFMVKILFMKFVISVLNLDTPKQNNEFFIYN